ncbi:uncharacterized protein BDR25DRAFT_317700 [Lindgomyces ingoldianus]|uniref:Uncharacterized protein n=1 Tax=Lindgomyces ingoldianus TaxID=673940 RepID=A0ACB6QI78_9PLEO|nr:uncharacterized protein BDR25DRAFT_317700 [Lindgomyces ingoldianus]KAF2466298.1 hypothetical protein BDR25DRAFT_317700 [Lindgomyces ingoldianus]
MSASMNMRKANMDNSFWIEVAYSTAICDFLCHAMQTLFSITPTPPPDLSRPRLRQLASWIRDDLDPIIAREGPDKLHPDDVLTLHEVFQALLHSQAITALDLRATRIHKAVQEVAGKATRWPGRLADDCDRIIAVWEVKFGRLDYLYPFMYGRGGRLEGIASADEFSKMALIKRWANTCPERIMPKTSRRHGSLGFTAGAWWLNPLFAHHAGIIDLESTEGGICFDKHGAYAVLLKDTGEIDAPSQDQLTYRCPRDDKGRYRLTSVDFRSRNPVRILRSHSLNSVWGPKAGLRYEGLFRVVGWIVRTIQPRDVIGLENKVGDIVFEVKFEREDPVPMDEVLKHPTSTETDDYAEYKRLRRAHRERHHHQQKAPPVATHIDPQRIDTNVPAPPPPINAPVAVGFGSSNIHTRASSKGSVRRTPSRQTLLKDAAPILPGQHKNNGNGDPPGLPAKPPDEESVRSIGAKGALGARSISPALLQKNHSVHSDSHPSLLKQSSSLKSGYTNQNHLSDIREIAPWIDYELHPSHPPSIKSRPPSIRKETDRISPNATRVISSQAQSSISTSIGRGSPSPTVDAEKRKRSHERSGIKFAIPSLAKKQSLRSVRAVPRSLNPLAKLFDGGAEGIDPERGYCSEEDCLTYPRREARMGEGRQRASSSSATVHPLSPIPVRPLSPMSLLISRRRDAIVYPHGFAAAGTIRSSQESATSSFVEDPFIDAPRQRENGVSSFNNVQILGSSEAQLIITNIPQERKHRPSIPAALKDFITLSPAATPVSVAAAISTPLSGHASSSASASASKIDGGSSPASEAERALRNAIGGKIMGPSERRILFKDPFKEIKRSGGKGWRDSVEKLAPESFG